MVDRGMVTGDLIQLFSFNHPVACIVSDAPYSCWKGHWTSTNHPVADGHDSFHWLS